MIISIIPVMALFIVFQKIHYGKYGRGRLERIKGRENETDISYIDCCALHRMFCVARFPAVLLPKTMTAMEVTR